MKKKKNIFIVIGLVVIIFLAIILSLYFFFTNKNRLTVTEKRFLANNSSIVQNIGVLNDANVFGDNGVGVFYDFLQDFSHKFDLKLNPVTYTASENVSGVRFTFGNTVNENEFLFYEGNYVLVSKKEDYIASVHDLNTQRIGILSDNVSYVTEYLNPSNLKINSYKTREELLDAFKKQNNVDYIMVPLSLYLDEILKNDYFISFHFSDIPYYYKLNFEDNPTLGSIFAKYFHQWKEEGLNASYKEHLFELFVNSLNISVTELEAMRSLSYEYSFVNNGPYEILSGGNYGGIIAQYLKEFTDFTETELKFTRYKNINKFENAVVNNKVNFYFGFYNLSNNYKSVHSGIPVRYNIIASQKSDTVVNSLKSLANSTIYVEEKSVLYNYLKSNSTAEVKTYKTERDLKKILRKGGIIAIDSNIYTAEKDLFAKYNVRFSETISTDYSFKINANETYTKLFTKYMNIRSPHETVYKGLYNYVLTFRMGTITGTIAKYFMYILIVFIIIFLYVYKITKRVKVTKKIKKEDKLKYIDQLTSLKNRNYLSENLENWSQNTIYPQTVVVIDLNNLQYINDTMGYEQGDEQIKSAANILVKTQLDNSDIVRTDGNEFVIYLIGYQTKQIISYVHKLNKEFKKQLPYDYGAAIAYSMIEDDIKTVEDAINEAVEDVKKQKENKKEGIR